MTFLPAPAPYPQSMLRNQRTSLQELYSHEGYLSKLNQELIKTILETEDSTALSVREMLQQQNILGVSCLPPPSRAGAPSAGSFQPLRSPLPVRECIASFHQSPVYWSSVEWITVTLTSKGKA